jgi:hypothetical protein
MNALDSIEMAAITRAMRGLVAVAVTCFATVGIWVPAQAQVGPTVPASDVLGDLGDVVLVGTDGDVLESGDGSTPFSVRLPVGSTCPGDSANDQWRLNTFLIPAEDDPLEVQFGSTGPEPPWTGSYPLFSFDGNMPVALTMLRRNPSPGSPGLIEALPLVSLTMVAQDFSKGGLFRLGVACTYFAQTTQYWDTEIELAPAPAGLDSELTWSIRGLPANVDDFGTFSESSSTGVIWLVAAAVGIAAVAGVFISRGSRRRVPLISKEKP